MSDRGLLQQNVSRDHIGFTYSAIGHRVAFAGGWLRRRCVPSRANISYGRYLPNQKRFQKYQKRGLETDILLHICRRFMK